MAHSIDVVETYHIHRSQDVHALINQYELLSSLGEGMHGKVMLARNSTTGEQVAIKIMKRIDPRNRHLPRSTRLGAAPMTAQQETESKIRREIAVMKKCSHQNLVQLREVIDDPASKKVYLVMENLAGGEVLWRNKDGPVAPVLGLDQVQRIIRDVTLGLEYLHHQGIIHRDIKPANLLWTADRQSVKICDFGVSHFTAATQQEPSLYDEAGLTKTAGSPAFFAPEICHIPAIDFNDSSSSPPDPQSSSPLSPSQSQVPPITKQIDIWALGVTFYCLLFGTVPWQGQTEFIMFRNICNDSFEIPDTMAAERIPTGGKEHRPEGKDLGWCVVDLLTGLLEKDQDKRIKLADIKRIPWIQTGVRDPERWLRETDPQTQTRVTITDEDTQGAIRPARFFYRNPRWLTNIAGKIKRVPLSFARSRSGSGSPIANEPATSPARGPNTRPAQTESVGRAAGLRTSSVVDRKRKRFTFGSSTPSRANTVPQNTRRNSAQKHHTQSLTDPSTQSDHSASLHSTSAGPSSLRPCRPPDSLHPSAASAEPGSSRGFFFAGTNTSVSTAGSPTTPDDNQFTGSGLKARLSQVIRQKGVKVVSKARGAVHSGGPEDGSRVRTSAETLDVVRTSEDLGLTPAMRASSWTGGDDSADGAEDDDGRSLEFTSSEAGGGTQDFNKSVVRFGAGGYVDRPPVASVYQPWSTPGASGSGTAHHSDSSNSTASTATPHPVDAAHHPSRVTSPLAHAHPASDEDSDEDDDLSSDVFEGHSQEDDGDSSDDDVLVLRTRRPSTVLSRSANASPLR